MSIQTIALASLLLASPSLLTAKTTRTYTRNIAILLYDGIELLDIAGPTEVLENAARYGANGQDPAFRLYTVSRTRAPVLSQGLVRIAPDYSMADSPNPSILILPGGAGGPALEDPSWMEWIRTSGLNADIVLTVCAGAFIARQAGLLDGIEVPSCDDAVEGLHSGKVIAAAGVSAGIDGALHVVARLLGRTVADRTAEAMEYKWMPESYLTTHYVRQTALSSTPSRARGSRG